MLPRVRQQTVCRSNGIFPIDRNQTIERRAGDRLDVNLAIVFTELDQCELHSQLQLSTQWRTALMDELPHLYVARAGSNSLRELEGGLDAIKPRQ